VRYLAAHAIPRLRAHVPIRVLSARRRAVSPSMVAANGERRRLHVGNRDASHFIIDERPDLVRAKLLRWLETAARQA